MDENVLLLTALVVAVLRSALDALDALGAARRGLATNCRRAPCAEDCACRA